MSNWIGPTGKQLWNYAMQVLHNFWGLNINTTAFCLGQSSIHLLLPKSSMTIHFKWLKNYQTYYVAFTPWRITGRQMAVYLFKNIFLVHKWASLPISFMPPKTLRVNGPLKTVLVYLVCSVTRFCDLLDFGQLFKALDTINLPKSPTVLGNFCVGAKNL